MALCQIVYANWILALQQITEKFMNMRRKGYGLPVDLEKAHYVINNLELQNVLQVGCN